MNINLFDELQADDETLARLHQRLDAAYRELTVSARLSAASC